MDLRLLLDLDCCLADFVGGVARLHGLAAANLLRHWPAGEYGMAPVLARALAERDPGGARPDPTALDRWFWAPINSAPGFWFGLGKLPWAYELFWLCFDAAGGKWAGDGVEGWRVASWGELYVITSPSRCQGCIREKEDWLFRHFGLPHDRMIPTPHKELMAVRNGKSFIDVKGLVYRSYAEPCLLVDDYGRNVDKFREAGGNAILVPAHHNQLHAHASDPMPHVKRELARLTGA